MDKSQPSQLVLFCQRVASVVYDHWFEYRYGLDTLQEMSIEALDVTDEAREHAVFYQGTRVLHLKSLLQTLKIPKSETFVDFGCGKGKTLLIAREYGFFKAVGVEFSKTLCDVAVKNIEQYGRKKTDGNRNIDVLNIDARDYEISKTDSVFYFFRPFDEYLMSQVLDNIQSSIKKDPRPVWILFSWLPYPELFDNYPQFLKLQEYRYGGAEVSVFKADQNTSA